MMGYLKESKRNNFLLVNDIYLLLVSLVILGGCSKNPPLGLVPGEEVQFGSYPQSLVTDTNIIEALNAASGDTPTPENYGYWTDYEYYSDGEVSFYMWYLDLYYQSVEYRGVYFSSYRPSYIFLSSSVGNSFQDDNGYYTSTFYWFRYEPITWRVLDVIDDRALLVSNKVLDSQDYDINESTFMMSGVTIYPNNYKYSHIRDWLNYRFLYSTFSIEESKRIQTTNIGDNMNDKVILLSYAEITNPVYGFPSEASRRITASAYAQVQGVCVFTIDGSGYWWSRSPSSGNEYTVRAVNANGEIYNEFFDCTSNGVVPAIWITI